MTTDQTANEVRDRETVVEGEMSEEDEVCFAHRLRRMNRIEAKP